MQEHETIVMHAEPIQVTTRVTLETDSKGNRKPKADISITKNLDTDDNLFKKITEDIREQASIVADIVDALEERAGTEQ